MANVEVVNNDDDDLITYINSFAIPPMKEEENMLKRSYDTLVNQQYNSMSDALKEKKHEVDFKIESPFMDMEKEIDKLRTSKRNMLLQIADMKKEIELMPQVCC